MKTAWRWRNKSYHITPNRMSRCEIMSCCSQSLKYHCFLRVIITSLSEREVEPLVCPMSNLPWDKLRCVRCEINMFTSNSTSHHDKSVIVGTWRLVCYMSIAVGQIEVFEMWSRKFKDQHQKHRQHKFVMVGRWNRFVLLQTDWGQIDMFHMWKL